MVKDKFRNKAEDKISSGEIEKLIKKDLDAKDLIHELKVHQVELELQNDELRKTQNELLATKEKYWDLFSKAPIAYFIFDSDGVIVEINNRGTEIMGTNRENLIQKPLLIYLDSEAQNQFYLHRQQVLNKKEPASCEIVMKRKNGEEFDAYLESVAISNLESDEEAIRTVILDISEKKQRKKKLKILHRAIEQSQTIVVITDAEGRIEYLNPKYEELTGYSASELLGGNPNIFKSDKKDEDFYNDLWSVIKSGQSWRGVFKNKKKNGELFEEEAIIVPITDNKGEITHYLKIAEDVTEQLALERELKKRVELERLLNDLAMNFINIAVDKIDDGINRALNKIGAFSGSEHAYIYSLTDEEEYFIKQYSWCRKNKNSENNSINKLKVSDYQFLISKFKKSMVLQKNVAELDGHKIFFEQNNVNSVVIIPMINENFITGFLGFNFTETKNKISQNLISFFEIVAEMFVNALERKKMESKLSNYTDKLENTNYALEKTYNKLNQEIEKARKLHTRFFPSEFPKLEGVSFAADYQPAANLGGDFYNILRVENKLIIYVVDIIGHGLDGAILNIFVRESINSFLLNRKNNSGELSPRLMLEFIYSRYCEEDFPDDYFICLLLGVLDLDTMELTISNAGFQIPALISGRDKLKKITTRGLPLSSAVNMNYFKAENIMEVKFNLEQGETVFLITDGLVEEEKDGEIYGLNRVEKSLKKNHYLPPEIMISEVKADFKKFVGSSKSKDDITILAMQYNNDAKDKFERILNSDYRLIEELKREISKFLECYNLEIDSLLIGLQEMLNNAIEHGNKEDISKKVAIDVYIYQEFIKIEIEDEGDGFNKTKEKKKKLDINNFSERGRGIMITRLAYDYLYYNGVGNKVTLIKERNSNNTRC